MSYKVLLVDDEIIELEWLKRRLPWAELGLEIVATANSGFSAINIVKEEAIDVLITDIKMPIMTGLELAEKVMEINPKIKIAFISGYGDFNYARRAIEVQAVGYVLKPIDNAELLNLVNSIVKSLNKESNLSYESNKLKETILSVKDKLVHQWLEGKDSLVDPYILSQYGIDLRNRSVKVGIIEVDDIHWKLSNYPEEQRRSMLEEICDFICDFIFEKELGVCIKIENHKFVLVAPVVEGEGLKNQLEELISLVRSKTDWTITISLGKKYTCIEDIPNSYCEAKSSLEYKMFIGKNKVINYENTKETAVQSAIHLEEKLETLFKALNSYDLVGVYDYLDQLFDIVEKLDSRVSVLNFTVHIISKLNLIFLKGNEDIYEILNWQINDLEILHQFETIDDIKTWLTKKFFELSELMLLKQQKKSRKIIDEIKKYTLQHMHEKITLQDISNIMGFSPNYLGHLFKEATGENFSDYLTKIRLEKACEYLLDPKIKVYEITDRIGYKNIIYFNRQFKDFYGFTPSEYRKRNKV